MSILYGPLTADPTRYLVLPGNTSLCPATAQQDCRLAPNKLTAAPGPGEYNIDRRDNPRIATGPTSSFRCTRTPLAVGTNLQTPAPGAYEILQGQHVQADKNGLILNDPFFRSQTKRSASFIAGSDVPGPGEYDVDRGVATVKEACVMGGGKGQGGVSAGRPGHQRCGHSREDEESSPGEILSNHVSSYSGEKKVLARCG